MLSRYTVSLFSWLLPPSIELPLATGIMTTSSAIVPDFPRYASAPFDDRDADLILRSSDNIDFRVSRFILRLASPFFASMLEIGQTQSEASGEAQANGDQVRDGCRVVPVQENGDTLDSLLRIIYPQKDPMLSDLVKVDAVMAAALKYEMEEAIALTGAKLLSFKSKEASRVWAIAVRHGLEPEARMAADELNREKISVLDNCPPEMQEVHAGAYYRLLQYRRLNGKVESDFEFCHPPSSKPDSSSNNALSLAPGSESQSTDAMNSNLPRLPTDIICRSSDGKEFPAHKAILAYASPVMAAMITSLPSPAPDSPVAEGACTDRVDGPTLAFDEDSTILGALVALSYPVSDGYEASFLSLQKVPDAVKKYEMNDAFNALDLRWSQLVEDDPLRAYLLAASYKSAKGARQAALRLLDRPMEDYHVPLLERSPLSVYRDVLLYQRACRAAASSTATDFDTIAGGSTCKDLTIQLPRKSVSCTNYYNNGYRCYGARDAEAYQQLGTNDPPSQFQLCIRCWVLGGAIARAINRLRSPSDGLFTTLESLKESESPLDLRIAAEDRPALQTVYTALYDQVLGKINKVCRSSSLRSYLLAISDTLRNRRQCPSISSSRIDMACKIIAS